MKKIITLGAIAWCVTLAAIVGGDERKRSGAEIEEGLIKEKSFELTSNANRWLKSLDSVAIGFLDCPECLRLLYAVDHEYETEPSYALLAEVYPDRTVLTVLREGKVSTAESELDQAQWKRIRETLSADRIWTKSDFQELMLSESKNESVWLIEYHRGLNVRIYLTEDLAANPIHSFNGHVPERREFASLFAEIFGSFPEKIIPEAEWFANLPNQYRSSRNEKPFPDSNSSNKPE